MTTGLKRDLEWIINQWLDEQCVCDVTDGYQHRATCPTAQPHAIEDLIDDILEYFRDTIKGTWEPHD